MNAVVNPEVTMKDLVWKLQAAASKYPQIDMPVKHYFANGMYLRECHIPKGVLFVGAVHKQEHFFLMTQGIAEVTTDDGVILMRAPMTVVSPPGTKRAGLTYEDTIFVSVHRTNLTDLDEIRAEISEPDPLNFYDASNRVRAGVLTYMEKLK